METPDEVQIKQQRELWKEAVEAKDLDKLMSFYVEGMEYVGFDIMPPIQFKGSAAFKENWKKFFALFEGNPRFEFKDMQVTCAGELAFVHGFTRFQGVMQGKSIDAWTRETNCLRKIDGRWLLMHDHISFPVDLSTGQGAMDLKP